MKVNLVKIVGLEKQTGELLLPKEPLRQLLFSDHVCACHNVLAQLDSGNFSRYFLSHEV